MALFCIILIVISSVLEINAMGPHGRAPKKNGGKEQTVSKSPRQTFHPQKVTVHVT